jgi:hypothetical protein
VQSWRQNANGPERFQTILRQSQKKSLVPSNLLDSLEMNASPATKSLGFMFGISEANQAAVNS